VPVWQSDTNSSSRTMASSSSLAMNRAPLVVCRGLVVPRLGPLLDLAHGPRGRGRLASVRSPTRCGKDLKIDGQVGGSAADHKGKQRSAWRSPEDC
jgi:hypothetical protein